MYMTKGFRSTDASYPFLLAFTVKTQRHKPMGKIYGIQN